MPHYVMIEGHSGYIWGQAFADNPVEACSKMDRELNLQPEIVEYWEAPRHEHDTGGACYWVYESPGDYDCQDGRSQKEIELVETFPFAAKVAYRVIRDPDEITD